MLREGRQSPKTLWMTPLMNKTTQAAGEKQQPEPDESWDGESPQMIRQMSSSDQNGKQHD